jgi:hypothetical protein
LTNCVCGNDCDCKNQGSRPFKFKYHEDDILASVDQHIKNTYSSHYADDGIQCFDALLALGNASSTFRDTALTYLWRYGKKDGKNIRDLYKAMHYITLCIYADHHIKDRE